MKHLFMVLLMLTIRVGLFSQTLSGVFSKNFFISFVIMLSSHIEVIQLHICGKALHFEPPVFSIISLRPQLFLKVAVFFVLILGFQPANAFQCTDPVIVKSTQTPAEGKIALTVSGGIPFEARNTRESFYKYRWSDASGELLSLQKDVSDLVPGTYTVAVSDNSGCRVVNTYRLEGIPKISLSTEKLDFVAPVNKSISKFFTIINTGNDDLKITKITLPVEVFTIDWIETTLPAGASKEIKVTFSPRAVKEYTSELEVESNAKEGRNTLSILARGVSPLESGLNIFPNPVNDVLHVELPAGKTTPVDSQLSDTNGRVLSKQKVVKEDKVTLDVSDCKEGIYLLMLYGGGNVEFKAVKKVIISK